MPQFVAYCKDKYNDFVKKKFTMNNNIELDD